MLGGRVPDPGAPERFFLWTRSSHRLFQSAGQMVCSAGKGRSVEIRHIFTRFSRLSFEYVLLFSYGFWNLNPVEEAIAGVRNVLDR